jgi:hypothetical protein
MDVFVNIILFFVLVVSFLLWSIIGFFLWVPLLMRTIVVFSVAVAHAAVSGQHADNLREPLRIASGFWVDGFRIIRETIQSKGLQRLDTKLETRIGRLIGEVFWASFVWILFLWALRPLLIHSMLEFVSTSIRTVTVWLDELSAFRVAGLVLAVALVAFVVGIFFGIGIVIRNLGVFEKSKGKATKTEN